MAKSEKDNDVMRFTAVEACTGYAGRGPPVQLYMSKTLSSRACVESRGVEAKKEPSIPDIY